MDSNRKHHSAIFGKADKTQNFDLKYTRKMDGRNVDKSEMQNHLF